jgi:ankyrin repeat protein
MHECHILEFLSRPESHVLIRSKNNLGHTPLHLAFNFLRPTVINGLLDLLGTDAPMLDVNIDGLNVLHLIAGQCLAKRNERLSDPSRFERKGLGADFVDSCEGLWKRCLDLGLSIDGPDGTASGNPPLFHYLAQKVRYASAEKYNISGTVIREAKAVPCCHVVHFSAFFSDANYAVRNGRGDTALHIIARNEPLVHETNSWPADGRSDSHDAELFRFLVYEKGMNPLLEDAEGNSCLDIISQKNRRSILSLFQSRN